MLKSVLEEDLKQIQEENAVEIASLIHLFHETLEYLLTTSKNADGPDEADRFYPKTPSARKARKRPLVATIVEDEEVVNWVVPDESPPLEVRRVRGSRAASRNASLKLKETSLNQKLRRPSDFDKRPDDVSFIEVSRSSKRHRNTRTTNATTSSESSFLSAKDRLDSLESVDIGIESDVGVKAKKSKNGKNRSRPTESIETMLTKTTTTVTVVRQKCETVVHSPTLIPQVKDTNTVGVTKVPNKLVSKPSTPVSKPSTPTTNRVVSPDVFFEDDQAFVPKIKLENLEISDDEDMPLQALIPKPAKKSGCNRKAKHFNVEISDDEDIPPQELFPKNKKNKRCVSEDKNVPARTPKVEHCDVPISDEENVSPKAVNPKPKKQKTIASDDVVPTRAKFSELNQLASTKTPVLCLKRVDEATIHKALNGKCEKLPLPTLSVKKRVKDYEKLVNVEKSPVLPNMPSDPPMRMTRTKMRNLASEAAQKKVQQVKTGTSLINQVARQSLNRAKRISLAKQRKVNDLVNSGKENSTAENLKVRSNIPLINLLSKQTKATPLMNHLPTRLALTSANRIAPSSNSSTKSVASEKSSNNIVTGMTTFLTKEPKVVVEDIEEKRKEELKRRQEKEDEAVRKRKELMESKIEKQKKKREEKLQKVQMSKEAMEREKMEQQTRLEKEKEEKKKQQQEREEKQREEMMRKKQQSQQKALEIEERRRQDEIARLARIKEQEEEHQRLLAQRKREEEEAERQHQKRLKEEREATAIREAMEKREKLLKMKQVAQKKSPNKKAEPSLDATFVMDKKKDLKSGHATVIRPPLRAFSENNYELQDVSAGESDDENDENENKSKIPKWVTHPSMRQLYFVQDAMKISAVNEYFGSHATTPNLSVMFNNPKLAMKQRSSSAVWRTPPRYSRMPK